MYLFPMSVSVRVSLDSRVVSVSGFIVTKLNVLSPCVVFNVSFDCVLFGSFVFPACAILLPAVLFICFVHFAWFLVLWCHDFVYIFRIAVCMFPGSLYPSRLRFWVFVVLF